MAPHSSTLAWNIPWMDEPGRPQSMGLLRVGHNWETSLSHIGEGNGNPFQRSCLENPRDGGAWWLPSMGSHRVGHDWSDLAAAAVPSLLKIIFYWRIISLQYFVVFLSNLNMNQPQVYIYPLPFETSFHLPLYLTPLGWYRAPVWVSWAIEEIPVGYFTYGNVSFHVTLSIRLILSSPPPRSISLFSMSVSPLPPCK